MRIYHEHLRKTVFDLDNVEKGYEKRLTLYRKTKNNIKKLILIVLMSFCPTSSPDSSDFSNS